MRDNPRVNSLQNFQKHSRLHFIGQWRSKAEELLRGWYFGKMDDDDADADHNVESGGEIRKESVGHKNTEGGGGVPSVSSTIATVPDQSGGGYLALASNGVEGNGLDLGQGQFVAKTPQAAAVMAPLEDPNPAEGVNVPDSIDGFGGNLNNRGKDEFHPEWHHGHLQQQAIFIHVDMDAYFCNVALSKPENAHLRDKPVAIASGNNHSDVSSCNYVARRRGVKAGMWVGGAREICPDLITLNYDLPRCEQLNEEIYRILLSSCPVGTRMSMEVYSVDDTMIAFDNASFEVAEQYCARIREAISSMSGGCTASCGIGNTILIARLATTLAKPDGIHSIKQAEVDGFLTTLPVTELHGVGRKTLEKITTLVVQQFGGPERAKEELVATPDQLAEDQLRKQQQSNVGEGEESGDDDGGEDAAPVGGNAQQGTYYPHQEDDQAVKYRILCSHLRKVPLKDLQKALGAKNGELFYNYCRGLDARVVRRTGDLDDQRMLGRNLSNAVGCTMNYAIRPKTVADTVQIFSQLVEDVVAKLRRFNATCSTIRVTIMERHPDYPRDTTKHLGMGRCVERHFHIKPLKPLGGNQQDEILREIKAILEDCILVLDGYSNPDNAKQMQESERVRKEALEKRHKLLIDVYDVRGVGIQCSSLNTQIRKSHSGSHLAAGANTSTIQLRQKKGAVSNSSAVQISLTAAFNRVRTLQGNKDERKRRLEGVGKSSADANNSNRLPERRKKLENQQEKHVHNADDAVLVVDDDASPLTAGGSIVDLVEESTTDNLVRVDVDNGVGSQPTVDPARYLVLSGTTQQEANKGNKPKPTSPNTISVDSLKGKLYSFHKAEQLAHEAVHLRGTIASMSASEAQRLETIVKDLTTIAVACVAQGQDLLAARGMLRRVVHLVAERRNMVGLSTAMRLVNDAKAAVNKALSSVLGPHANGCGLALGF